MKIEANISIHCSACSTQIENEKDIFLMDNINFGLRMKICKKCNDDIVRDLLTRKPTPDEMLKSFFSKIYIGAYHQAIDNHAPDQAGFIANIVAPDQFEKAYAAFKTGFFEKENDKHEQPSGGAEKKQFRE